MAYTFTSKKQLRKAYWQMIEECTDEDTRGKKTRFHLEHNIGFEEWKESLCKNGEISQALYDRATLY